MEENSNRDDETASSSRESLALIKDELPGTVLCDWCGKSRERFAKIVKPNHLRVSEEHPRREKTDKAYAILERKKKKKKTRKFFLSVGVINI